jgi:hypothetical protein
VARVVGVLLLVWNLAGVAAFVAQRATDLDALAATDPVQADALRAMPAWAWAAYAVAVSTGVAGAVALLLRRRAAIALFSVSVAAELVQFGWTFAATEVLARNGAGAAVFPAVIVGGSVFAAAWSARVTSPRT